MAENSKIEWTDHTFNPWIGCTKVSVSKTCAGHEAPGGGCDGCYAEQSTPVRVLRSRGIETWGPGNPRQRTKTWGDPVKWNRQHEAFFAEHGRRQRVFCASLADWLDNEAPIEWLVDLLDLIRCTPHLDWLLLSKRIGNWRKRLEAALESFGTGPTPPQWDMVAAWINGAAPSNVWIGATVVNQAEADRDVPKLLQVPTRVRFLSIEPMLGPIDIQAAINRMPWQIGGGDAGLHWVICGGESGPGARPMHPDWARSLRDQCAAAGVPFLFKQWGEWLPADGPRVGGAFGDALRGDRRAWVWLDRDGSVHDRDEQSNRHRSVYGNYLMARIGKKAAGRQLDGRTHDGFPA